MFSHVLCSSAKPSHSDLELELNVEPSGIYVLLHDPEVLVINLDQRWGQVCSVGDHVRLHFGKDIDMENIVDFPVWW
jgi:hypothetical protein